MSAGAGMQQAWDMMHNYLKVEIAGRAYKAANELRNEAIDNVLKGQRSGRVYRVPMTSKSYTASAPGEPPANRTGVFRMAWHPDVRIGTEGNNFTAISEINNPVTIPSGELLGDILEKGSPGGKIAPRPHHDRIKEAALPEIMNIYQRPYF